MIVTLLKNKFVDQLHWIEEDEMLDLVAIAQSSPGAIAVNGAIIVGYKLCGILGALVSAIGAVLPPLILLSLISVGYQAFCENVIVKALLRGMQAGVAAVITSVVLDMGAKPCKERDYLSIFIMVACFVLNYFLNVNVVLLIVAAALIGIVRTKWAERGNKL